MSSFEIFELVIMYTIAGTLVVWGVLVILALLLIAIIWREDIFPFSKQKRRKENEDNLFCEYRVICLFRKV